MSDRNPHTTRTDLTPVYVSRRPTGIVYPGYEAVALAKHDTCLLENRAGRGLVQAGLATCVGIDKMAHAELWDAEHGGTFGLAYLSWDAFKATAKLKRLAKRHDDALASKAREAVTKASKKRR